MQGVGSMGNVVPKIIPIENKSSSTFTGFEITFFTPYEANKAMSTLAIFLPNTIDGIPARVGVFCFSAKKLNRASLLKL